MLAPSILSKQSIRINYRESSIDVLHLQCKGDVESVNARPDKVCWMNQDVVLYYSSVWGFCLFFFLFFTDFTTNLILTKNNPPINWHLIFLIFQFEVSGFFNWIWICNNVWFLTNQLHVQCICFLTTERCNCDNVHVSGKQDLIVIIRG